MAASPQRRTQVILLLGRYALLAAVIGFAVYYLANQWPAVRLALAEIAPLSLVASFLFVILGLAAGTMSWVTILKALGGPIPVLRAAQISLVGGLGKYVPGSVWAYVMQMELGRSHGIVRACVLITSLYAAGIGVIASLLLAGVALPGVIQDQPELMWLFALLPIGLICLHPRVMTFLASLVLRIFRRPPLAHQISFRVVLVATGWILLSYCLYGLHLWILVNSLVDPDLPTLILLTGAVALGFTIGFFAFFLPSGVGVREAILIGAMIMVITEAQGSAISLVSRGLFTIGDLAMAGGSALMVVLARRRLAPAERLDIAINYPQDLVPDE